MAEKEKSENKSAHLKEANSEKLAVFGGELLKRKSSTCLLPTITENNKNKQFNKPLEKTPSRVFNSAALQVDSTQVINYLPYIF